MHTATRTYCRGEQIADRYIHLAGLAAALVGSILLIATAAERAGALIIVSSAVYGIGLVCMISASALYNFAYDFGAPSRRREWFRRLDHAAIFLMIAGTYTPFVLVRMGGAWGFGIATFVWVAAITGITVKLLYPSRLEGISTGLYLALGWVIIVAPGQLLAALSPPAVIMLAAGGLLYCLGIVFHLWRQLPYHNAIWHGFVLGAAGCHWVAVFSGVVLAA